MSIYWPIILTSLQGIGGLFAVQEQILAISTSSLGTESSIEYKISGIAIAILADTMLQGTINWDHAFITIGFATFIVMTNHICSENDRNPRNKEPKFGELTINIYYIYILVKGILELSVKKNIPNT